MADERLEQASLEQSSGIDDGETTLRDSDGTVELSVEDIVPVDPSESPHAALHQASEAHEETTQVLDRSQLEQQSAADATNEDLRTTMQQSEISESRTAEHRVPEALLRQMIPGDETQKLEASDVPHTQKMQAVGTRPMPRVEDPEETAVRNTEDGQWAELDDDGFYTFIARVGDDGRVTLPEAMLAEAGSDEKVMVFVKTKVL